MILKSSSNKDTVYIYQDQGVYKSPCLKEAFIKKFPSLKIKTLNAHHIKNDSWQHTALALVMPGGADVLYCQKLKGKGNRIIKQYVEEGGTYLGFCAGAYYGTSYCDFAHTLYPNNFSKVLEERELAFYPGTGVGPFLAPYKVNTEIGARIALIEWENEKDRSKELYNVYYNGGCYFAHAELYQNTKVLAYYVHSDLEKQPAIIESKVNEGKAILCGPHPEVTSAALIKAVKHKTEGWEYLKKTIIPALKDLKHLTLFQKIVARSWT